MVSPLIRALTSRAAGPVATAAALALTVALAWTWTSAAQSRAELEARIGALTQEAAASGASLKAQLAGCQGALRAAGSARAVATAAFDEELGPEAMAARLVAEAPAGLDVCARMEAADRAVLQTLR